MDVDEKIGEYLKVRKPSYRWEEVEELMLKLKIINEMLKKISENW